MVKTRGLHGLAWRVTALLAAVGMLMFFFDRRVRPVVWQYAVNCAKTMSGEVVAAAINEVLGDGEYTYDSFAVVARGESGNVLSVELQTVTVNRLSAALMEACNRLLSEDRYSETAFPLFNVLGSTFLMGRGPTISIHIQQNGAITTKMNSAFSSAGVNQTLHRLELSVTCRVVMMAVGMSEPIETESTFLIAETIIVGAVPDTYANITI